MTPHALLFTIAAVGIAETVYLIRTRLAHRAPVCPIGGGCATVLESKYNRMFGVHNDLLGLVFYVVVAVLLAFLVIGIGQLALWDVVVKIMITGGVLMSVVLLYLQARVIKAWCFWCIMSALTTFLMGLITLVSKLIIV